MLDAVVVVAAAAVAVAAVADGVATRPLAVDVAKNAIIINTNSKQNPTNIKSHT